MGLFGEKRFFDFDRSGSLDSFERGLMQHEQDVECSRMFGRRSDDFYDDPLMDEIHRELGIDLGDGFDGDFGDF